MIARQRPSPFAALPVNHVSDVDTVYIREENILHRVRRDDILFLRADGNYVELHATSRRFVLRTSMRDVMHQLGALRFIQINRQLSINIQHLARVDRDTVEVEGRTLSLGRSYRAALIERLQLLG